MKVVNRYKNSKQEKVNKFAKEDVQCTNKKDIPRGTDKDTKSDRNTEGDSASSTDKANQTLKNDADM